VNPFEMVVVIVAMSLIAWVITKRMEFRGKGPSPDSQLTHENRRLREEMAETQKRLRVLERIVTDRGADTAAQIEALRDRDTIDNGNQVQ
jgi:hypothetical protein